MSYLEALPHRWISVQVPGTGSARLATTYAAYDASSVPRAPADLDGWAWLRSAPSRQGGSTMAEPSEAAACDLSLEAIQGMLGDAAPLDLLRFAEDPSLRRRMWSATDSYYDLGQRLEAVDGGRLLHLVSDSQWVQHWSLFLGHDGVTAVVVSPFPVGFDLDDDEFRDEGSEPVRCAATFSEFSWRWWMDNEIFRRTHLDRLPLSEAQHDYVRQYGEPQPAS